ncbi:dehydrogenase of unknown specificity, short-chain alcohol dehydrogenase [Caulobacter sp. AP07]|uniref:coniferyl-alcohol dehydrogenase n=1 Tax=Caulobacter sp. AP07 TaxID=1144304 RepID=UPI000271ED62|nr:coniferyl-alcohol dehydrogenase [Caulobacter sp. AP07]EJL35869.1 dehydrogenase of unknown specificity, short-chain alcohol dehydrogenase [Caulobacter sp. AP07]
MNSLENKTLVITGAASGIGHETVLIAKAQGARVLAVDINEPTAAVDEFFRADLSNPGSIDDLARALPEGLDGLANIAGLPPTRSAEQVLAVNLIGLKHLTYRLVDKMNRGAAIVNLASLAGHGWARSLEQVKAAQDLDFDGIAAFCRAQDMSAERAYSFSKEAVIVWTFHNRFTWRDHGIRMNAVSPGPIATPILPDFIQAFGKLVEEDRVNTGRAANAADVAPVVAFLLSDPSRWIRGANLPVDGGASAHILAQAHGL